jgi:HTH-type transcriptional regulator, competence development regulator
MPYTNMPEQNIKLPLGALFRRMREEKGLLIRQVAAVTELDQAIISRIENGDRIPTKEQVMKLAGLYNLDVKETMSAWLAERMVRDYGGEPYVSEALREAHDRVLFSLNSGPGSLSGQAQSPAMPSGKTDENLNQKRKPGRQARKPSI